MLGGWSLPGVMVKRYHPFPSMGVRWGSWKIQASFQVLEDMLKRKSENGIPGREMVYILGNHKDCDVLEFKIILENGRRTWKGIKGSSQIKSKGSRKSHFMSYLGTWNLFIGLVHGRTAWDCSQNVVNVSIFLKKVSKAFKYSTTQKLRIFALKAFKWMTILFIN